MSVVKRIFNGFCIFWLLALICFAGAAVLVAPVFLADAFSAWWILLYAPHFLACFYVMGE